MKENKTINKKLSEKVNNVKNAVLDNEDVIKAVGATIIVLSGLITLTRKKSLSNRYIAKTFSKDIYNLIKGKKILGLCRAKCSDATELMCDAEECLNSIITDNPTGKYVLAVINYK